MAFFHRNKIAWTACFMFFFALIAGLSITMQFNPNPSGSAQLSSEKDIYSETVQKVFNNRCVACHSCFDSPCQLNLQSYEGLERGVTAKDVYDGSRSETVDPTRMFEDAQSTKDWRAKGFHDVIGNLESSVLINSLSSTKRERPTVPSQKSRNCTSQDNKPELNEQNPQLAMPYGMAPIDNEKVTQVYNWMKQGAPKPAPKHQTLFSEESRGQVAEWNSFFNGKDNREKLVSRYIFEHLYLAHLFFDGSVNADGTPKEFLKIIRSSTNCDNPTIIPTKHANDYPRTEQFFYCLVKDETTNVNKTHLPYKLSPKKLDWMKKNFLSGSWTAGPLPKYFNEIAANPFEAFKDIPVEARYRFLLEDAQFHIMTFIKGPVCNGTTAVNSIQEQFFVFFMDPGSDLMTQSKEYEDSVRTNVDLPGEFGSNVKIGKIPEKWTQYTANRKKYEEVERRELKRLKPNGLSLNDIWDGDGHNDNAVLTVFRHDDNAAVVKGARGDLSKTYFMLDYSTFERLCYNLVVNFNVFGNVGHQALTRFYMDILRMDSEDNFLYFLPKAERKNVKSYWYKGGFLTKLQLSYLKEFEFPDIETAVKFTKKDNPRLELVQKILFERLNPSVRGPDDTLNWKAIKTTESKDFTETELRSIASVKGKDKKFSENFPELSLLILPEAESGEARVYSIVHNIEHTNVAWVLTGDRVKEEDTLTIERGFYGAYPNMFFTVRKDKGQTLSKLVQSLSKISNDKQYKEFVKEYGVDRMDPLLWNLYDIAQKDFIKIQPEHAGYLDLSRYAF